MSDQQPNPLDSLLSGFSLGPAWARPKDESQKSSPTREPREPREFKPRRDNDRDQNNRSRNRNNRRDFNKNERFEPRREEIQPAEGVNINIYPDKHAVQLLCKEIQHVARVYALYDLAEIILHDRARTVASFEISKKKEPFFHCKIDNAILLTKEEAVQHILNAPWRSQFIEESTIEIDPPKGNFQSIAKCGISGALLGPPNYHAYQTEIRRVHRERFSNMPFDSYVAKIKTERSEEVVNEWLETMKQQTRWCIIQPEKDASPKSSAAPSVATEPSPSSDSSEPESDTTPLVETPEETPAAIDDTNWITERPLLERAIATELLDKIYTRTHKVDVPSNIPAKVLSPGLLVRIKASANHHRKHPAILIPALCKILEAEHMPVFKRKGKLFTGPARPQVLDPAAVLAPRPAQMVTWIRENSPAKLEGLWKAVLPEGATAPPAEFAADLYWLLQQGHILLHRDDTLVLQEPKTTPPPPDKGKVRVATKQPTKAEDDQGIDNPGMDDCTQSSETAEQALSSDSSDSPEAPEPQPIEQPSQEPLPQEPTDQPEPSSTDH